MNVYLVRHGEVEHNRLGFYSNQDEDLNEKGIAQANALKGIVSTIPYSICYCSTLKRAKHTAEIINHSNRIIVPVTHLAERDPGALSGKPLECTNREEYWNFYSKVDYGAEPMSEFFARVFYFLDYLKTKSDRDILIVGHSGVSKAFYAYFNGIPEDGHFLNLGLKNCELKRYIL